MSVLSYQEYLGLADDLKLSTTVTQKLAFLLLLSLMALNANRMLLCFRMDTYTFHAGKLFCTPHFKQLFKTKGNYDEGFGLESRAKHWSSNSNHSEQPASLNGTTSAAPRPAGESAETNGSASPSTNGAASPEPEPVPEQREPEPEPEVRPSASDSEPEPEPAGSEHGADVFQQVYESTVADGL